MAKYLVIVESPAKAKTIKKFLGSNYKVEASNGHVRDLPKSQLGVDVDNDFEPKYITIRGKGELLAKLRKEVKKAQKIFLATDPDREGEAISWHLVHSLKLEDKVVSRISFNEITKNAVKNSIKQAREIDMDLVDSQQARRILDRVVGYKISPLLWKKIKKGLSAGRVQSSALKLICDREEEINAFIPEEYWSLEAILKINQTQESINCKFYGTTKEKIKISSKDELDQIVNNLEGADYKISEVKKRDRHKKPLNPFITSTLQQEASKKLNFSTQKTMRIAQQLYEGIDIEKEGTVGLITYLRTDSIRISEEAETQLREYIQNEYGEQYLREAVKEKKSTKKVQDAHEAIRPTYVHLKPENIKKSLSRDQFRLYQLIWTRFVASRMKPAKYITTSIKIDAKEYRFTASTSTLDFDGFLKVYKMNEEEKENKIISNIQEDTKLTLDELEPKQHFTQPPPRFSEASLVKTLEELGIGRPSTYAPTITTIMQRRYIIKEDKMLFPTELGEIVTNIMKEYFKDIVNTNFTATLEKELDQVEEGELFWKEVLRKFYPDFIVTVEKAEEEIGDIKIEEEVTDVICEQCGENMVIRYGRHGKFLACPAFPECRNTKPYFEKIGVDCPKCDGEVVIRKTKKGRRYFGCENIPECDFMTWQKPTDTKCPKCDAVLLEKGKHLVCSDEKCNFQTENNK
ncbi:DNA topoisomerase I [Natranaerovirga hydrolytica]|uniref:DNA topoisomerase 1 n=1 Tax=Natranaerovirga hydrolytica TaxID=680378 RepID=A0A4R1MZ99_9FIRM|nr:type I DNA topoisomerase [Natranaerovirga hydrolytica]TCK97882.1 DNA topoisomerase I [Natranaerovirga hydrolytica]